MNKLFINQKYTKKEIEFLQFNKKNEYNFLIVNDSIDKEIIYELFTGLLENLLCFSLENKTLILYNNKDYVRIRNIYDILIDDLGRRVSIFNGFLYRFTSLDSITYLDKIISKYINYKYGLYNVRSLFLKLDKLNDELFFELKNVIFYKYIDDSSFHLLLNGLFECDLNVSKTAKKIYMHRNTVNYKIDGLFKDTGIDLTKFYDCLIMYKLFKEDPYIEE